MADCLTQLQDCLDQLATQFYASIRYLSTHHPSSTMLLPSQTPLGLAPPTTPPLLNNPTEYNNSNNSNNAPDPSGAVTTASLENAPDLNSNSNNNNDNNNPNTGIQPPSNADNGPDSPRTFASAQQELAQDLLIKARQIEYLIGVLPGVEKSETEQETRIRVLEGELRSAEEERKSAVADMERWRERLEVVLGGVRR